MKKQDIPIIFAVDDAYIPFLAVTIQSLSDHISKKNQYYLKVLYTKIKDENKKKILKYENENIHIEFVNVKKDIERMESKLPVGYFYSSATYYRVLIPNLYPQYDKVLYLDADIVILEDVAKLYNVNIDDYLLGCMPEPWIRKVKEFRVYAEKVLGLASYKKYFNAGILLMNLNALREMNFEDVFLHLLDSVKYRFAQDQDYLNRICKGRVKYIRSAWNASGYLYKKENPKIVHYTIYKPWLIKDMPNSEYFWDAAKKTEFYDYIKSLMQDNGTESGDKSVEAFKETAVYESSCVGNG